MSHLHVFIALVRKDILIDLRRKENLLSMFFFSLVTLLLFHFSHPPHLFQHLVPGMIWVVFLMAGVLGLSKAFVQEAEGGCLEALRMAPIDRGILFLGKVAGVSIFLLLLQMLMFPLFVVFFNLEPPGNPGALVLVCLGGILGFTPLGTLLAAMTTSLRGREVLLPLLLFPLLVPNLISVVKITENLLQQQTAAMQAPWWHLLWGFDIILGTVCFLIFEFVLED